MNAGELCIREVVTATSGESVLDAARRMAEHDVGTLVVVERRDGAVRPIGIVTDRDLVTRALTRTDLRSDELTLQQVMRTDVITAQEDDHVDDVLAKLRQYAIRRIPIVNDRGELQGILALDDLQAWLGTQMNDATELVERQGRGAD